MTPAKAKKLLEKRVAQTIKKELDKKSYEESAWLKAFKKAEGDETKARLYYVEIREDDLYEEIDETVKENIENQLRKEEEEKQRLRQKKIDEKEMEEARKIIRDMNRKK
jgi:hypothetical protein